MDPWEGDYHQSLTQNPYLYALANPVRFVDSTGYFPTEEDIRNGGAEFTCRCGWIDWNHVRNSDSLGYELTDDLEYAAGNFRPDPGLRDNWGIYVGISVGSGGIEFDFFGEHAVIPNDRLSSMNDTCRTTLAASMFMDANEHFEELQGALGWLPFGVGARLRSSYFSEEDLPSDIIGFYVGFQRFHTDLTSDQLYEQVREKCGAVGEQKSLEVFEETYENGAKAVTNWRCWYPRCLPLVGCNSALCEGSRAWPSEFSAITSSRIWSQYDGTWWWYRGWYADGHLIPTRRSRVYRFQSHDNLRPPTPPSPLSTPHP